MRSTTQLSLTNAAKIVGIERSTLYRHIEEKGISVIKKSGSHPKIDISELIRIYGDQVDPTKLEKVHTKNNTKVLSDATEKESNDNSSLAKSERISLLEEERQREREQYKEQIEHLKTLLESEQQERRKVTALLTDQRTEYSKDNTEDLQKSIKALENRLSNQEKAAKEREEKEQKLLDENKRIKQAYMKQKQALEAEQNKSIWKKLFG